MKQPFFLNLFGLVFIIFAVNFDGLSFGLTIGARAVREAERGACLAAQAFETDKAFELAEKEQR